MSAFFLNDQKKWLQSAVGLEKPNGGNPFHRKEAISFLHCELGFWHLATNLCKFFEWKSKYLYTGLFDVENLWHLWVLKTNRAPTDFLAHSSFWFFFRFLLETKHTRSNLITSSPKGYRWRSPTTNQPTIVQRVTGNSPGPEKKSRNFSQKVATFLPKKITLQVDCIFLFGLPNSAELQRRSTVSTEDLYEGWFFVALVSVMFISGWVCCPYLEDRPGGCKVVIGSPQIIRFISAIKRIFSKGSLSNLILRKTSWAVGFPTSLLAHSGWCSSCPFGPPGTAGVSTMTRKRASKGGAVSTVSTTKNLQGKGVCRP